MKATQTLKDEHNGVRIILEVLSKINSQIKKGKEFNEEHIDEIIEFLRVFVDQCHHTKEEVFLFPAIETVGDQKDSALVKELTNEHDKGRAFVVSFSESLENYKNGNKEILKTMSPEVENYINLLQEHIKKEEDYLFTKADQLLSVAEQKDMYEEFENVEHDVIGLGRHEEFHLMISELRKKYLD